MPLNLCHLREKEVAIAQGFTIMADHLKTLEDLKNKTPMSSPSHSHPRHSDLIVPGDLGITWF